MQFIIIECKWEEKVLAKGQKWMYEWFVCYSPDAYTLTDVGSAHMQMIGPNTETNKQQPQTGVGIWEKRWKRMEGKWHCPTWSHVQSFSSEENNF